jgi:uncharacterized protein with FMN-binding domain
MRPSSIVILALGSAATLAGAWLLGQPSLLETIRIETPRSNAVATETPRPSLSTSATPTRTIPPSTGQPSTAPPQPVTTTIDGSVVTTKYGTVQVQAVITDGRLVDVLAIKLTDSSDTSVSLSANAAPLLREEVLAAQSTAVANVSGATYTSEAYLSSLQAALDQAGL